MDSSIIVGIDVGTSKISTLVGHLDREEKLRIIGVGIEPSQGIRKGNVVDLGAAAQAISRSIDKAERTAGLEIKSAFVSLAGSQISSINSRGVVGVAGRVIDEEDILRAIDAARAVAIPHNREVIHVIQRSYSVDGQEGIRMPVGMHGYRLEVEAHIITSGSAAVENLRQCLDYSDVEAMQFVLNPLASGEVVLSETEREMGAIVCDIGGGTTSIAIYIDGDVWYTTVLPLGGDHITSDIAHGLRIPVPKAEEIKLQHGQVAFEAKSSSELFSVRPFGEEQAIEVPYKDLAMIIEARVEEIFSLVLQEIKRSGYDGLLPAGMVLTGGSSRLPGIQKSASQVLGLPVRNAQPEGIYGLSDRVEAPEYSTGIGLLHWAILMNEVGTNYQNGHKSARPLDNNWDKMREFLSRLLP
ncbi:MAG TPA: cell division protein FtsA [Anaerolineales bacterium]|nr:cell division protein FtsA [Anaerolineales bacterium]